MKALDTNVLVRYLTQDDAVQSALANGIMEQARKHEALLFINRVVLCELVWVLESCYHYEGQVVANVIEQVLGTRQFMVEDAEIAWQSLAVYKKGIADFSDILIGKCNRSAACKVTVTFDKQAAKLDDFSLIK